MTVAELIAKLEGLPRGMRVLVDGYEGGLENPGDIRIASVGASDYLKSYWGEFDEVPRDMDKPWFAAVVIPR